MQNKEYLLALQKKASLGNSIINFDEVIAAAKNKLLLWDMSEQQIKNINPATILNTRTTFYSTFRVMLQNLNLQEGVIMFLREAPSLNLQLSRFG